MSGRGLIVCAAIAATPTLAACDKLFDIRSVPDPDDGGPSDGQNDGRRPADIGPPGDAIAPCFTLPVQVPGVSNGFDPQMRADRLEIIYAKGNPGSYSLFHGTRLDTAELFSESELDTLTTSSEETDPALTADGLLLVFKSNRNGNGQHVWQATRSTTADPFGNVLLVPGVESIAPSGIDLSPDGLTIYIDDGSRLFVAHRQSQTAAFTNPTEVSSAHIDYPSVTPNGLEVFSNGAGVLRATRQTNADTDKFQGADSIDPNGNDPDVLADNSAIVVVSGDTFYTLERCN